MEQEESSTSGPDIYRVCTRTEDVKLLSELCKNCPIPHNIEAGLPRIIAEIEIQRQGNTEEGFIQYCKDALDNHVKKASQAANDLANPAKRSGLSFANVLEAKFWNLELCKLYKEELESIAIQSHNTTGKAISSNYFHLPPEGIARRNKLSKEARNASFRQATASQILKRLTGEKKRNFLEQRTQNRQNIDTYQKWINGQLFHLKQELPAEENKQLERDIQNEASSIARVLPYSENYGSYLIEKLKSESLSGVSGLLQFIREPWYPGLAGFYLLDKADDTAYFRDIIIEHLIQEPKDTTPVMQRAIEWLTAEIERLATPGTSAFRQTHIHLPAPNENNTLPIQAEHLRIDEVLVISRAALDRLLLDAAMVEPDTAPDRYRAKPTVKPWQWANVRAALQEKLLLAELNDADAAQLFSETYGATVSRGTMQQRPQYQQSSRHQTRRIKAYAEFYARLPTLKSL
jgi:hypothetical protein